MSRKQTIQKQRRRPVRKRRRFREISASQALGILAVLALSVFVVWLFTHKNAQTISVNNQPFAVIENIGITDGELQAFVEAKLADQSGAKTRLEDALAITPVHTFQTSFDSLEHTLVLLCREIAYKQEAASVYVNGANAAVVSGADEAAALLDEIMQAYIEEGATVVNKGFVETVEIKNEFVYPNEIMSKEKASAILTKQDAVRKPYRVVAGDNWWGIAYAFGMDLNELFEINADITSETPLIAGTDITINALTPFVSVKTTEQKSYAALSAAERKLIPANGQTGYAVQIMKINGIPKEATLIQP